MLSRKLPLLLLVGAPSVCAASAATPVAAPNVVQLAAVDVLGEPVRIGPEQRRSTILFFMSKRSREASSEFGRVVDERLLEAPVESVAIVDVRKYGGWLRGLATSRMQKSEREARARRRERRIARGADASDAAVNRWHLVGDFDGALFARFGVGADPERPLAFLVDPRGELRGPYRDPDALCAAVARLASPSRAEARRAIVAR